MYADIGLTYVSWPFILLYTRLYGSYSETFMSAETCRDPRVHSHGSLQWGGTPTRQGRCRLLIRPLNPSIPCILINRPEVLEPLCTLWVHRKAIAHLK